MNPMSEKTYKLREDVVIPAGTLARGRLKGIGLEDKPNFYGKIDLRETWEITDGEYEGQVVCRWVSDVYGTKSNLYKDVKALLLSPPIELSLGDLIDKEAMLLFDEKIKTDGEVDHKIDKVIPLLTEPQRQQALNKEAQARSAQPAAVAGMISEYDIKRVHTVANDKGLTKDGYAHTLDKRFGVAKTSELTKGQAEIFIKEIGGLSVAEIEAFNTIAPDATEPPAEQPLDDPWAGE
jgi:hypothetical protein